MLALAYANIAKLSGPWEKFSILVERDCHNAVGSVKCLFDAVTVVHINVDVQDPFVVAQEFQNAEHDVYGCQLRFQ
jgi:hypothetical protein